MNMIKVPHDIDTGFFSSSPFTKEEQMLYNYLLRLNHLKHPYKNKYLLSFKEVFNNYPNAVNEQLLEEISSRQFEMPEKFVNDHFPLEFGSTRILPFPVISCSHVFQLELNDLLKKFFIYLQQRRADKRGEITEKSEEDDD